MSWLPDEQKIEAQRKGGRVLGRWGLYARVLEHAQEIVAREGTTMDAMRCAGRIAALVRASDFDGYWGEKVSIGYSEESRWLTWCAQYPDEIHVNDPTPEAPTDER